MFMLVGCSIMAEIYFFSEPYNSFKIPSGGEFSGVIAYSIVNLCLVAIISKQSKLKSDLIAIHAEQRKWISNISHEIRSPLGGIAGLVKLLSEKDSAPSLQKQYLALLDQTTEQLKTLVTELLDLSILQSRKKVLNPVVFSFAEEINNLIEVFRIKAKQKKLELIYDPSNLPSLIHGDRTKLFQVISNLIDNAIKFTEFGSVAVSITSSTHFSTQRHIIRFHVIDTGPGLSEIEIQMAFEPFFKIADNRSRSYQGAGLGLSICKELVSLMNGSIGVTSKNSAGCNFWFEVELAEATSLETRPYNPIKVVHDVSKTNACGIQVLVAEDNLPSKLVIETFFRKANVAADFVSDGKAALKAASNKKYDLIFLDWNLPLLNGPLVARTIRETYQTKEYKALFIGITAGSPADKNFQKNKLEFDSVFLKPVEEHIFLEFLEETIDFLSELGSTNSGLPKQNKYEDAIKKIFIAEYPQRIHSIRESFDQKNWTELQRKIHHLKSSCLAADGLNASVLCSSLESSCVNNNVFEICKNFSLLDEELETLTSQLRAELLFHDTLL